MGKVWDILPPRPREHRAPIARRRRKPNMTLFFGIVVIIIIGAIFYSSSQSPSSTPNKEPTVASDQTSSPNINSQNGPTIKLLNGTSGSVATNTLKQLLLDNDITVTKTENALNLYQESIVYYDQSVYSTAQKIAEIFSEYSPKLQLFSQASSYDIIVVIGQKQ